MIYALGRGLELPDKKALNDICSSTAAQGDKFSALILAIVNSDQFQKRTAIGN